MLMGFLWMVTLMMILWWFLGERVVIRLAQFMICARSEVRARSVKCSYRRSESSENTAFSLIIKLIFPDYFFDSFRSPWAGSRKVEETSNEGRV